MMTNQSDTRKFLQALDDTTDKFTFQTFDEKGKDKSLVRILHGTFDQHAEQLEKLNKKGAGVYVTVNATDLKGRKAENIKRVRYVFADLDGAPLGPAKTPHPHMIVESSPKRWHVYWRVEGLALDQFRGAQRKLIKRLNSDKGIVDLPRVLRLPGFLHQKGKPFRTKIVDVWAGKPYKAEKFINGHDKDEEEKSKHVGRINNLPPIDIKEVEAALDIIPSDDYNIWLKVCAALREDLGEAGKPIFDRWSRKSEKYDKRKCDQKWEDCAEIHDIHVGTIFHMATEIEPTWRELDVIPEGASVEHFVSFLPGNDYIYTPTGQHWSARPVNSRLPKQQVGAKYVKATDWLDKYRKVEAMTWSPGDPVLISDRLASAEGGWVEMPGTVCFNAYRPPSLKAGEAGRAMRWVEHIHRLYPDEAEHLISWFALRLQAPGIKINHGLIIGGEQGIGKDMILKPVRTAVGIWNSVNVAPKDVMSNFNTHVRSVICQIDEARDLGDTRHYDFYEHLKTLTTAPPDILRCNEKHVSPYAVMNCTGVIITTNHRTGAIYLPPGDRRFYVAWSIRNKEEFSPSYFNDLEAFYNNGGYEHVATYLRSYDTKKFDPKAPPPQTEAWKDIVEANLPIEDAEFAAALNLLGRPSAVTIAQIQNVASHEFETWLLDRRNTKKIAHRLESCGYIAVRNEKVGHNRWRFRNKNGRQQEVAIYALASLSPPVRIKAAKQLLLRLQEDIPKKQVL